MENGHRVENVPRSWNALFAQIRARPVLYFGSVSLQAFHHFLVGFGFAPVVYGVSAKRRKKVEDFGWDAFERYVAAQHKEWRVNLNSFGLAQFEAQGKDDKTFDPWSDYLGAWDIWWRWYDEFVASGPH